MLHDAGKCKDEFDDYLVAAVKNGKVASHEERTELVKDMMKDNKITLLQEHVFCWIDGTAVKSWGFLR